jgi:ABC-type nitrate/sulfonate/bicarbonate transport system substrate-binding protein
MTRRRARLAACLALSVCFAAVTTACTSEALTIGPPVPTRVGGDTGDSTPPDMTVSAGAPFSAARCAANREAGTITFLTGFDFSASASMVDVYVARAAGYYRALCLDVDIRASLSTDNYPLIASGAAQFASGGSFGELVDFAGRNEAQFKALAVEGRTSIDALIVRPGAISGLPDIKGRKIGVKGSVPASIKAMLLKEGLVENQDYDAVPLEGFDAVADLKLTEIAGFAGYKSNEPLQLKAAGVKFDLYDPADEGIPGSFGVIYTNATFIDKHRTAAEDFMRATMRGLHDAVANPAAAAEQAVELIDANPNRLEFSSASELARWTVEAKLVTAGTSPTAPLGVPQPDQLKNEVDSYGKIGVFGGITPDYTVMFDPTMVKRLYDDTGVVIWPGA